MASTDIRVLVYTLLLLVVIQGVQAQDSTCDVTVPCGCCFDGGVSCSGPPNNYCGSNTCKDGYYGIRCISLCPAVCVSCNQDFGRTQQCYDCVNGRYGQNCSKECSTCLRCNKDTGICTACGYGYYGSNCTHSCSDNCLTKNCDVNSGRCYDCKYGHHGDKCNESCSSTCNNGLCDRDSGMCQECIAGYYGNYCNKTCSNNCFNNACNMNTSICDNCVVGWHGPYCNKTCPSTCKNKKCIRNQGTCTFGCIENFIGDGCDDCQIGKYGKQCGEQCPPNCLNNKCHRSNGTCTQGCSPGFSDAQLCCVNSLQCSSCSSQHECSHCINGWFGKACDHTCPIKCEGPCDKTTGNCFKCKLNYYGLQCETICSEHCMSTGLNISRCAYESGYCVFGCVSNFYGNKCELMCSEHCNSTCDQQTGECHSCQVERFGQFCDKQCLQGCLKQSNEITCNKSYGNCLQGCLNGFYGDNCNTNCSSGCLDTTCNSSTGQCISGCKEGFTGMFCSKEVGTELGSKSSLAVAVSVSLGLGAVVLTGVIVGVVLFRKRLAILFKRGDNSQSMNTYDDLQSDLRDTGATYSGVSYQNTHPDSERSGVYVNTTIQQTSNNTTVESESSSYVNLMQ